MQTTNTYQNPYFGNINDGDKHHTFSLNNLRTCFANMDTKLHWENIYQTKQPNEVSWTEDIPHVSLAFIRENSTSKNSKIIDVGGGDSKLVDYLLAEGYSNITVLDISQAAIEKAKKRLGGKADHVKWIVSDILDFNPTETYDIWHDRAAFHFQIESSQRSKYLDIVGRAVKKVLIIGTFSTDGPEKCSGLDIQQYDQASMSKAIDGIHFELIECKDIEHTTPAGNKQNFIFCSFKRPL